MKLSGREVEGAAGCGDGDFRSEACWSEDCAGEGSA